MTEQIQDNLYCIKVPLPGNPLKALNSYVIRTPSRSLIIDTGFNRPECLAAMREGIAELGLDMEKTDLFLTHFHSDHCGLINHLPAPGSTVYMFHLDAASLHEHIRLRRGHWHRMEAQVVRMGYPQEGFRRSTQDNPIVSLAPREDRPITELRDGELLKVGELGLRVVHTPGHTPGHACLYWEEEEILFCGDQLLYTISPNITDWDEVGALEDYLRSLKRIGGMKVRLGLAAHRENRPDGFYQRVEALIDHHRVRLEEALELVRQTPGIDAYTTASRMTWSIRAKDWEDFPPNQKWFAVGEALSHLIYLERQGQITASLEDGVKRYRVH